MTQFNSSNSPYLSGEIGSSTALEEIRKGISLIVAISEEHTHYMLHNIFEHLFHGKKLHEHINHPEVIEFLHGLLSELDHYIHDSKHAFKGKLICKV